MTHSDDYNFEGKNLKRTIDLNQLDGFHDLFNEEYGMRMFSHSFELENEKYQYCMKFVCSFDSINLFLFGGDSYCQNNLGLDPTTCHLGNSHPMDWPGADYTSMKCVPKDSLLYLHMLGYRYDDKDTTEVQQIFSVSDRCMIKILENKKAETVR